VADLIFAAAILGVEMAGRTKREREKGMER
jgi:hypothetical protein